MMFARTAARLGNLKHAIWYVALLGFVVSSVFCFVVYPRISGSLNLLLDPDLHGKLGYGLLKNHSLSYYPDTEPVIDRGPGYPAFIALMLVVSGNWWPYSVQIGQCLLFACMCALVFWMSSTLWSRQVAVPITAICSLFPTMLWYTSRIWVETLGIFLCTAIVAATLYLMQRPSAWRALLLGGTIAAAALSKTTFLAFAVVIPCTLLLTRPRRVGVVPAVCVLATTLLVVSPWTYRNWQLTGKFIPVNVMFGWNCQVGDFVVDDFHKAPFALAALWDMDVEGIRAVRYSLPQDMPKYEQAIAADSIYTRMSIQRYLNEPGFFAKKLVYNALLFWVLGETPTKSLAIALIQLPLLALFIASGIRLGKRSRSGGVPGVLYIVVLTYYALHLPSLSEFRYSVVLVPTMMVGALGPVLHSWTAKVGTK